MAGHSCSFGCAKFRFSLAQTRGAGISHKKAQKTQKSFVTLVSLCGYFLFVGGCLSRGSRAGALLLSDVLGCVPAWPPSTASPKVNFTSASNFLYLSYLMIS